MGVKLNDRAKAEIEAALSRGNDVEVRRKGDGLIVLEVRKIIKYRPCSIGDREGQSEPATNR